MNGNSKPNPDGRRRWFMPGAGMVCIVMLIAVATLLARTPEVLAQTATRTPTSTPTPRVVRGTRTPTPTQTLTQTVTQTGTTTPTATLTSTLEATPTPLAFVILPAPSVKNKLAGNVVSAAGVPVSANYPTLFVDRLDFAMENVRDLTVGDTQGAGIAWVRFLIVDNAGNIVHASEAGEGSPFCAFGQDASGCLPHDFARTDNRWQNRAPAHSGKYTLVAFAQGEEPDHKGTWTLPFELRLAEDNLDDTDGAARIRSIVREGDDLLVEVETFGFTPFVRATHLHFYVEGLDEEEAVGGVAGVIEYPANYNQPGAYGMSRARIPLAEIAKESTYGSADAMVLCVAVAHPDESVLVGRGECAANR